MIKENPAMPDDGCYRVPDDFPNPPSTGSVSGTQPKFLAAEWNGKFYIGLTPPELFARWEIVEDLAQQMMTKLLKPRAEKYANLSEVAILDQYLTRLYQSGFGSEQEMRWLIRRVAHLLNWPIPDKAQTSAPT